MDNLEDRLDAAIERGKERIRENGLILNLDAPDPNGKWDAARQVVEEDERAAGCGTAVLAVIGVLAALAAAGGLA